MNPILLGVLIVVGIELFFLGVWWLAGILTKIDSMEYKMRGLEILLNSEAEMRGNLRLRIDSLEKSKDNNAKDVWQFKDVSVTPLNFPYQSVPPPKTQKRKKGR